MVVVLISIVSVVFRSIIFTEASKSTQNFVNVTALAKEYITTLVLQISLIAHRDKFLLRWQALGCLATSIPSHEYTTHHHDILLHHWSHHPASRPTTAIVSMDPERKLGFVRVHQLLPDPIYLLLLVWSAKHAGL